MSVLSLKNPLFFDVFISELAELSLEGPTYEIAVAALRLQTLLSEKKDEICDNPTV